MIDRPADLVAIPPLARTVIYYLLAIGNVVVGAYTLAGRLDSIYLVIVSGLSGVFFGVAGSNVAAKPAGAALVANTQADELAADQVV